MVESEMLLQAEICTNEIDDDGDGFVDAYDMDCDCVNAFNTLCIPACEGTKDSIYPIALRERWQSEMYVAHKYRSISNIVVGDTNIYTVGSSYRKDSVIHQISVFDVDGTIVDTIKIDTTEHHYASYVRNLAIAKVNGEKRIFTNKNRNKLLGVSLDGVAEIIHDDFASIESISRTPKLADFNGDGNPEVYMGNKVISTVTGNTLIDGMGNVGCNATTLFIACPFGPISIAGDFTDSPGLELACGDVVYELDIQNPIDISGNSYRTIDAPSGVLEGYSAMADVNGDGLLDVIVVRGNIRADGGLWVWTPQTGELVADIPNLISNGYKGGVPVVCDLNNDCLMEIIVAFGRDIRVYTFDGTMELKLMYTIPTNDPSGVTSPTAFDLNNDGRVEIIYRDTETLYIIDGPSGAVVWQRTLFSGTLLESPVVSDVDDDGHAEILIHGGITGHDSVRLFCFESANEPWAPARKVWNQVGYHVTNVNDDLTIPMHQQPLTSLFPTESCLQPTCPQVYNTFMMQATYRTQAGCKIETPRDDLTLTATYECGGDSVEICAYLEGLDSVRYESGIPAWCGATLDHRWYQGLEVLDTFMILDTFCFKLPSYALDDSIFISVNDPMFGYPYPSDLLLEEDCDRIDNTVFLHRAIEDELITTIDTSICMGSALVITADSTKYHTFSWNTGEMTATKVIDSGGIYVVGYKDECNRSYGDTIRVESIELLDLLPSDSIQSCYGDTIFLGIPEDVNAIYWQSALANLSCDTCQEVWSVVDTSYLLSLSGNYLGCTVKDSLWIEASDGYATYDTIYFCEGDSIFIHEAWINDFGDYTFRYSDSRGCDSIVYLNTLELKSYDIGDTVTICEGDSIMLGVTWIKRDTTLLLEYVSGEGCDSVINHTVVVNPVDHKYDSLTVCEGDSIWIKDSWYYEETTVKDTVFIDACQQITQTKIKIIESSQDTTMFTLCPLDSILIGGQWYDKGGEYRLHMVNHLGCDSVQTVYIDEVLGPGEVEKIPDCTNGGYITYIEEMEGWSMIWDTGVEGSSATYENDISSGKVTLIHEDGCTEEIDFDLPVIEEINNTIFGDTVVEEGSMLEYYLQLDWKDWDIDWQSEADILLVESSLIVHCSEDSCEVLLELINTLTGCSYEVLWRIIVRPHKDLIIPNAFSPNDDGINDVWEVNMTEYRQNSLRVYDRWGNVMYSDADKEYLSWNGKTNGTMAQNGVYVYIITYVDGDGRTAKKAGDVLLMK